MILEGEALALRQNNKEALRRRDDTAGMAWGSAVGYYLLTSVSINWCTVNSI